MEERTINGELIHIAWTPRLPLEYGADFAGCVLVGYAELESVFGEPLQVLKDYHIDVCWQIRQADVPHLSAIIYNRKPGPVDTMWLSQTRFWHVDSPHGEMGINWVRSLLPSNVPLEVSPAQGPYVVAPVEMSTIFKQIRGANDSAIAWVGHDGREVEHERQVAQMEANVRKFGCVDDLAAALLALHAEHHRMVGYDGEGKRLLGIIEATYLQATGQSIWEKSPEEALVY